MSTPFEQGYDAAANGFKLGDNPLFGLQTEEEIQWNKGWLAGRVALFPLEWEYETPPRDDDEPF